MKKFGLAVGVLALLVAMGSTASAQLRGMGRIQGTVTEEGGAPLAEVSIKATLAGSAGEITGTSDAKGNWLIGGMGKGEWDVTFEKAGYAPRKAKVSLAVELARVPAITVAMKKS